MHKLKSLALLALAGLGLSASGGVTTNAWWDVTFEPGTFQEGFQGLVPGELGPLTNDASKAQVIQPYATGVWTALDGDESYVTNSLATNWVNGAMTEVSNTTYIKLDTQGNDLKWTVADNNAMADGLKALVDADLYLVGSDSEPTDFDEGNDVQTAVYLKNEIQEESGETTNSVLCVYVFDPTLNNGNGANTWQELDGVKLEDNAWAHVQVLVDHSDDVNSPPTVQVFVNGTQMHARNGDATSWTAANGSNSQDAGRVSSVAFRGTGAVDNFVGQTILDDPDKFDFTAEVYMNGQLQPVGTEGNVSRVVISNDVGKTAKFEGFLTCNADFDREVDPTWSLTKIEITNFVNGLVTTLNYSWNSAGFRIEGDESDAVEITTASGWQTGSFNVSPSTAGATANSTIVKIYFEDLPEEGTFNANATTTIGETTTTDSQKVKPSDFTEENPTKTIEWTFDAEKNGNVLRTIQLYNGATLEYANKTATVTVTTNAALQADTLFAAATYVPGSLAEGQDLRWSEAAGLYTFEAYVPPVAIRVSADGTTTNECSSLREAIEDYAQEGDTVYLVADDRVSFTAEAPILDIDFEVTIDGGSNTLYGMTGYAAGYHEIRVGGNSNVTIKDLKLTEFGDTAVRNDSVMPIVARSAYTGKLTLDGVQIDKFNRQALCLFGGTFEITNCVITGSADTATGNYFQSAIEVFNAEGTVAATTISGIGSNLPVWGAASCFNLNSDWSQTPWVGGTGSITILSGSYTGQYIVLGMTNAAQTVDIQGGTFIATAPAADSTFGLDDQSTGDPSKASITISGGWFDREPEAKFLAKGYRADEAAPSTDTPWTVVLGNAIWIGGASGDWNVPANWDIGCLPTTTTVVTFTNNAEVGISPTVCKCKEMVLDNANVTIGRANSGTGADLNFYKNAGSAVSGTGTLTLNTVGLFNQNNSGVLTIGTDLDIQGDVTFKGVKDNNGGAGSWTVTGKTTIADGVTVKTIDDAITTFQGDIEIDAGSQVTFFAAYGAQGTNHGGEIVVASTATVTLASPDTKLMLQTRNSGKITINDSQVVTDSTDYYVKKSSQQNVDTGNNGVVNQTTYEVLQKRTVTVTADEGLTVEGVTTGLFVPGTNFVITVTGVGAGYEPSVMITNATDILLTTNVASFTYTAPDSNIGVVVSQVVQTFDITFKPENGEADIVTNVAYSATAYAPAAPTLAGFTFLGWTNALDATDTTLYEGNPMPAAYADATYAAKYEANAVEVTAVDPGQSMSADEKAANPPVEVTAAGFTVHFKGVAGVTYELLAAESLSVTQTQWENPDGTTVTVVDTVDVTANTAANVQTLTAPMTGNGVPTARFFKIGAKQTE